jgi:hypothetical protein
MMDVGISKTILAKIDEVIELCYPTPQEIADRIQDLQSQFQHATEVRACLRDRLAPPLQSVAGQPKRSRPSDTALDTAGSEEILRLEGKLSDLKAQISRLRRAQK